MVPAFKWIARAEGISYLVLLFIAMPLKYIWLLPTTVSVVGAIHGVLFVAYIILAVGVKKYLKWNFITFAVVIFASIIPFGTFYVEKKYL